MEKKSAATRLYGLIGKCGTLGLEPVCSTGLTSVDEALGGGLYPGVTFLSGMPGMGKTAFAAQVFLSACTHPDTWAGFYELESSKSEVVARMLTILSTQVAGSTDAYLSKADLSSVEDLCDAKEATLGQALDRFSETVIGRSCVVRDAASLERLLLQRGYGLDDDDCAEDVKVAHIATARDDSGFTLEDDTDASRAFIALDYLQIADDSRYPGDETGRIRAAVDDLKRWREGLYQPAAILAISSMSRSGYRDQRAYAAMAGSSAIEYAAEAVIVLERDEAFKPSPKQAEEMERRGLQRMTLTVTKNRHGRAGGSVPLWFDGAHSRFMEAGRSA